MSTAHYIPKPHVSAAVKQLRTWVSLCAAVFALAAATQMLVFGFAQYTDVRWTEVREVKLDRPLRVVGGIQASAGAAGSDAASPAARPEEVVTGGIRGGIGEVKDAVDVNRVRSSTDRVMERAASIACGAGVVSAIMLTVFALLGVVVAGGASIPGVERVVTAGAWSFVLALMCLPWDAILPTLGIPGVFVGYARMTAIVDAQASSASTLGSFGALMQWVAAPLVSLFAALGVCLWFRAGVDRGIIVTAPSELDKAVEREVEMIAKRGVASGTPKTVGALNRAIGDDAPMHAMPNMPSAGVASSGPADLGAHRTLSAVERAIEEAALTATSLAEETTAAGKPRRSRSVADGDFKRPI